MMPNNSRDPLTDRVEAIYQAIAVMEETEISPASERVSFKDLISLVTEPDFNLNQTQWKIISATPRLKNDYDGLKSRYGFLTMPVAAAAASLDGLKSRPFPGGVIDCFPSRARPNQIIVVIAIEDVTKNPRMLILEGPAGFHKEILSEPDEDGRIQLIKDKNKPADNLFLLLVNDPLTKGTFLGAIDPDL